MKRAAPERHARATFFRLAGGLGAVDGHELLCSRLNRLAISRCSRARHFGDGISIQDRAIENILLAKDSRKRVVARLTYAAAIHTLTHE
jgi:hypothetical protein